MTLWLNCATSECCLLNFYVRSKLWTQWKWWWKITPAWKEDWDLLKENMGKFVHRHRPVEMSIAQSSACTHCCCTAFCTAVGPLLMWVKWRGRSFLSSCPSTQDGLYLTHSSLATQALSCTRKAKKHSYFREFKFKRWYEIGSTERREYRKPNVHRKSMIELYFSLPVVLSGCYKNTEACWLVMQLNLKQLSEKTEVI